MQFGSYFKTGKGHRLVHEREMSSGYLPPNMIYFVQIYYTTVFLDCAEHVAGWIERDGCATGHLIHSQL